MRRSNSKTLSSISTDDLESLAVLSPNVNKLVQKSEIPPENVETKLLVKGVCCASEIPLVKKILGIVEGVGEVDVNVPLRQVNVTHDIRVAPVATLVNALNDANLDASRYRDYVVDLKDSRYPGFLPTVAFSTWAISILQVGVCNALQNGDKIEGEFGTIWTAIVGVLVGIWGWMVAAGDGIQKAVGGSGSDSGGGGKESWSKWLFGFDLGGGEPKSSDAEEHGTSKENSSKDAKPRAKPHKEFLAPRRSALAEDWANARAEFLETAKPESDYLSARDYLASQPGSVATHYSQDIVGDSYKSALKSDTTEPLLNAGPLCAETTNFLFAVLPLLAIPCGIRIYQRAFYGLFRYGKGMGMNMLTTIVVFGSPFVGEFRDPALLVSLFLFTDHLQDVVAGKSRSVMGGFQQKLDSSKEMVETTRGAVPMKQVKLGDEVLIRPGTKIPFDGQVSQTAVDDGAIAVDESIVTGESRPVSRAVGDPLLGGTLCISGSCIMSVSKVGGQSTVSRLVNQTQNAIAERSPTQLMIEKFTGMYTPIVISLCLVSAVATWVAYFFLDEISMVEAKSYSRNILTLLICSCPCALVISTPMAYVSAFVSAMRRDIVVKSADGIEKVAKLNVLCFDKTGTLTEGEFQILSWQAVNQKHTNLNHYQILELVHTLEETSSHPLAVALCRYTRRQLQLADFEIKPLGKNSRFRLNKGVEVLPGKGIRAGVVGLGTVEIGNELLAESKGIRGVREGLDTALSRGFIWQNNKVIAVFTASDPLRKTSGRALRALKALGIRTVMATGDQTSQAYGIRDRIIKEDANDLKQPLLGKDDADSLLEINAELTPEQKVECISKERERGRKSGGSGDSKYNKNIVAMVGDGVNDGPALAASDLGFSMAAAGSALALETSDIGLLDSDLIHIPWLVELGRLTMTIFRQNIFFSLAFKIVVMVTVAFGYGDLTMAIIADFLSMLFVFLNAMRLLSFKGARDYSTDFQSKGEDFCAASEEDKLVKKKREERLILETEPSASGSGSDPN